jgi:hypothetical protein
MTALDHCPALDRRHRAALEEATRAADSARAFAALARLTARDAAQPMPPGAYECWATSDGLRVMHIRPAGTQTPGECSLRQVWPPLPNGAGM